MIRRAIPRVPAGIFREINGHSKNKEKMPIHLALFGFPLVSANNKTNIFH